MNKKKTKYLKIKCTNHINLYAAHLLVIPELLWDKKLCKKNHTCTCVTGMLMFI